MIFNSAPPIYPIPPQSKKPQKALHEDGGGGG